MKEIKIAKEISKHDDKKRFAFTLAEVLVTLAILGIVAAMTVPTLLKNQTESANRTRLRKAVSVYERAINTIITENDLRSTDALDNWANNDGNCTNVRAYFKIVEDGNNLCQFKTGDGVWWDFGSNPNGASMTKALVAFKNENLTKAAAIDEISNDAFFLMTLFDENGAPRVLDIGYANKIGRSSAIINTAKVLAFINKKSLDLRDYAVLCEGNNKTSCMYITEGGAKNSYSYFYNDKGEMTVYRARCDENGINCTAAESLSTRVDDLNDERGVALSNTFCDVQGDSCNEGHIVHRCMSSDTECSTLYNQVSANIGTFNTEEGNLELAIFRTHNSCTPTQIRNGSTNCTTTGYDATYYYDGGYYLVTYDTSPTSANAQVRDIKVMGYNENGSPLYYMMYTDCTSGNALNCSSCESHSKPCP